MAERFSGPSEAQRGQRRWRRDWFPYQEYLNVHYSHMDELYRRGYVLRDSLEFIEQYDQAGELRFVVLRGRLACRNDAAVRVDKVLAVQKGRANRDEVLGVRYSYHAWVRSRPRRDLFRFDNAHGDVSTLHCHVFDAGVEVRVVPLTHDDLPRLDLIIESAVEMAQDS